MSPQELIRTLIARAGGELPVARAMGMPTFQGTLYKFAHGHTRSPARSTAEKIARHFKIEVDAMYDPRVSADEARRLGLSGPTDSAQINEPAPVYSQPSSWPLAPWINKADWDALSVEQRAIVAWEAKKVMDTMLSPSTGAHSKPRRMGTK